MDSFLQIKLNSAKEFKNWKMRVIFNCPFLYGLRRYSEIVLKSIYETNCFISLKLSLDFPFFLFRKIIGTSLNWNLHR